MSAFSDDMAIDLGTVNTLVYVRGRGVIIDEPSMVAVSTRLGRREIWAVGLAVKHLVGRTPEQLEAVRPLRDGVIADFVAAGEMLRQFIGRAKSVTQFRRPRILICVPSGSSPVERRAVHEAALEAGARKVHLMEEPVAAAMGAGLSIDEPFASMIIDVGGGTTDVAVLSRGAVIDSRSLRCAGNAMDEAIIRHVRRVHGIVIGEAVAERLKLEAGSARTEMNGRETEVHVRGRDVKNRRESSAVLAPDEIARALARPVEQIAEFIQRTLEELPVEQSDQITSQGICLSGGGALLDRFDEELTRRLGVTVFVPRDPLHSVIKGSAIALDHLDTRPHLLIRA